MLRCTRKHTGFEADEVAWRFVPEADAAGIYPCKLGIQSSHCSLPQDVLTSDEGQDTVWRVFTSYALRRNLEIVLFGSATSA